MNVEIDKKYNNVFGMSASNKIRIVSFKLSVPRIGLFNYFIISYPFVHLVDNVLQGKIYLYLR